MKRFIMKLLISLVMSLVILLMAGVGVSIYAGYIEPRRLVKEEYSIKIRNTLGGKRIKVVQFSDVHLGDFYSLEQLEELVEKINKQEPDIVVFTGDLMDMPARYKKRDQIGEVLGQIESQYGKFAVWGNHDYGGAGVKYYEKIMQSSGFQLLTNQHLTIDLENGQKVNVIGLDDGLLGEPNSQVAFRGMEQGDLNLLIMHEPDLVEDVEWEKIDVALAGHSHGGQVQLPFKGPLITPPLARKYTDGMYTLQEDKYLYVNSGVGTTKIPVRFLNPPQIAVFNISL